MMRHVLIFQLVNFFLFFNSSLFALAFVLNSEVLYCEMCAVSSYHLSVVLFFCQTRLTNRFCYLYDKSNWNEAVGINCTVL